MRDLPTKTCDFTSGKQPIELTDLKVKVFVRKSVILKNTVRFSTLFQEFIGTKKAGAKRSGEYLLTLVNNKGRRRATAKNRKTKLKTGLAPDLAV